MKLELIAFTQRGNALAEQLAKTLSDHEIGRAHV